MRRLILNKSISTIKLTWIRSIFQSRESGLPQEIRVLSIASLLPAHLQLTPPNFHAKSAVIHASLPQQPQHSTFLLCLVIPNLTTMEDAELEQVRATLATVFG